MSRTARVNKWAATAIEWIGLALTAIRIIKPKKRGIIVNLDKGLKELRNIEETDGATTNAWNTILAAAEAGEPATLTAEDCVYMAAFKTRFFDKYIKKALNTLSGLTSWSTTPPGD
jgi:hypothetical protein